MPETIKIRLPDGSEKEVPRGTTPLEIARGISPRLAEAALVARIAPLNGSSSGSAHQPADEKAVEQAKDGQLVDLTRPLESDAELRILTEKDAETLEVYRHSTAHLLAAAVLDLFPETKLGHGPPTESGFFYDFYRETPFTPDDLHRLERKMQELVEQNIPYAQDFLPREEGLRQFKAEGDFMKCHF